MIKQTATGSGGQFKGKTKLPPVGATQEVTIDADSHAKRVQFI